MIYGIAGKIINLYRLVFARPLFYKFNKLLWLCSLHGMGILNSENDSVSGEANFLKRILVGEDSPIILDVGSNIGRYTKKVLANNPTAIVYAFEPHPQTFQELSKNMAGIKNVYTICSAVGSDDGVVSLYDYASSDGSSHASIYKGVIEDVHHAPSIRHETALTKLDTFCRAKGINKIFLLKVDVEGNELEVLRGLQFYIANNLVQIIHFEFNEMNVVSRVFFSDFCAQLTDYEFYRLLPNGMIPLGRYQGLSHEIFAYQNIVAFLK
ncbi:FkbM family methyltransferase [Polynucleobacter paneuropaeus]|nr:FkbM family methyltransferase [Polynucleobacter paneuropaeus]